MLSLIHFCIPNCVSVRSAICGSYIPGVYPKLLMCLSLHMKNTKFPAATQQFLLIREFHVASGRDLSVLFVAYSDSISLSRYCTLSWQNMYRFCCVDTIACTEDGNISLYGIIRSSASVLAEKFVALDIQLSWSLFISWDSITLFVGYHDSLSISFKNTNHE